MSTMPAADHTPDAELVRALLRDQAPELAGLPLAPLAHGWDNVSMRIGERHVVRLPRREPAARLIGNEQRWLPRLAPHLPLPVPVPVHAGRPGHGYPWTWSVTAYLPGTNAGQADTIDPAAAAEALARFLAALHREAPADAPANPVRGVDLAHRDQAFTRNLARLDSAIDVRRARATWAAGLAATPWNQPRVWLHGDLHPGNILVQRGELAAIIDFGDITSGDPATDLAVAWMLLPSPDRDAFWTTYAAHARHAVSQDLQVRSRAWALMFASVFLAHSADNPMMDRIGRRAAHAVLAEGA